MLLLRVKRNKLFIERYIMENICDLKSNTSNEINILDEINNEIENDKEYAYSKMIEREYNHVVNYINSEF